MRTSRTLVAAASVAALAVSGAALHGSASAAAPHPKVLASGLVGPLRAAITPHGTAFVSQNFGGPIVKVPPGRAPVPIHAEAGNVEVGGVSVRKGVVTFTDTYMDAQGNTTDSKLKRLSRWGKRVTFSVDLYRYEKRVNPDHRVTYGFEHLSKSCASQLPAEVGPPSYHGIVDSHPYSTYVTKRWTYVGEAAGNDVLAVSSKGRIRTVAVLPPTRARITADVAGEFGLPDCTVGKVYRFESVPTDVELGRDGMLYVTTLGGAAGEALPVGSVYRVDPRTHRSTKVASGLSGPVGLAVARNGDLYVSQLFGGQISKIRHGSSRVTEFAAANAPAEVEIAHGYLYATIDALPPDNGAPNGKLVRYRY